MTNDFCKFPEDTVVHILSRLPPKSLMRFKCIHTSFLTIIENSEFVAKHLSNSQQYVLLKRTHSLNNVGDTSNIGKRPDLFFKLDFCNDKDCDEHNNNYSNVENVLSDPLSMYLKARGENLELEILVSGTLICQCHGMMCLSSVANYHKLLLCNLATREFKLVSETCLPLNPSNLECKGKSSVGFGYDPKSDNYKLVRIVCYGEEELEDNRLIIFPPRVEVHTLGTNSWQEISFSNLETKSTIFWPRYYPYYYKGFCYWMGYEQQKEFKNFYFKSDDEYIRELIVYFDMDREIFNYVLLPEELNLPESVAYFMRISVWNESLALFGVYYIEQLVEPEIGIWVLDDIDGVKDSWTLKQSFRPPPIGAQISLYLWKSDEMIILCYDRLVSYLVSYNFETKEIKPFPLFESKWPDSDNIEILVTMNSLVFR